MKEKSYILKWQEQQKIKHIWVVVLSFLLIFSVALVFSSKYLKEQKQFNFSFELQRYQEASTQQQEMLMLEKYYEISQRFLKVAAEKNMTLDAWVERRINFRMANIQRQEANQFLASLARDENRFFDLEEFDLSAPRDDVGLFALAGQNSLMLTVKGTLIFRADGDAR